MSPRTDPPSSAATRGFAARCAPALAAGLALATLAVFQADRSSAAETAFLAVWVTAVLLPAAALAPAPGWEAVLGAPLAVLAGSALPAGPARLAAVGALLVAVLAAAGGRTLARAVPAAERFGAEGVAAWPDTFALPRVGAPGAPGGWPVFLGRLQLVLPLALGVQALLQSPLLLAPDARAAALFVVPALAGAWALGRLAVVAGTPTALVAGALAAIVGPGFTPTTALALLGVAAGGEAAARIAGRAASVPAAAVMGAVIVAGLAVETRASAAALAAGGIAVLAALASRAGGGPRTGAEEDPGGAVGRSGWAVRGTWLVALGLPAAAAAVALRPLPEALTLLAWVPILLPVLILDPPPGRSAAVAAAAGLALAAALALPGAGALAAPLALLALLVLAPRAHPGADGTRLLDRLPFGSGRELPAVVATWSAALLAATALLAAPPWLRPAPGAADPAFFGVGLDLDRVISVMVVTFVAALSWGRFLPRPEWRTAVLLGLGLIVGGAGGGRPLLDGPAVVLEPDRPRLAAELSGMPSPPVAIYTHLSNGLALPAGTEVATVTLVDGNGEAVESLALYAGEDTGEWAARRADVAARPGLAAPQPWAAWVAAGDPGDPERRPFFGQYYRTLLGLEYVGGATWLMVERSPELPPDVLITVHRIEVRD